MFRLLNGYGYLPYYGGYAANVMAAPTVGLAVQVVTAENFVVEVDRIAALLRTYPFIIVDTEYPGTVHRPPAGRREVNLTPGQRYALVKANVDELPVVQLGITLCDAEGRLPVVADTHGHAFDRAWEFYFSDFDLLRHRHALASVEFLLSQGVDFQQAREVGISSAAFATRLAAALSPARLRGELTWVAFGGAYDFAYMVKMLSGSQPLPGTRREFMAQARRLLGGQLFDAKYMAEHSGRGDLCIGGLRSVAARVGAPLLNPELPCLAGPKSRTACFIYIAMKRYFREYDNDGSCFEGLIDAFH